VSDDQHIENKEKKDRSPNFPFISLQKAVSRAEAINAAHRREAARLPSVGNTWSYGAKSSGLLQTVAALKQFGLLEDMGSGDDRKVMLTDLARRILLDTRPGAKEQALKEAARRPRLIAEYLSRWVPERPSDSHCISELHLDRGFTSDAARSFLRVFDETVSFANLSEDDGEGANPNPSIDSPMQEISTLPGERRQLVQLAAPQPLAPPIADADAPFSQRYKVTVADDRLTVTAVLKSPAEVDRIIRILEANKALLEDDLIG
jgi:hypothetical protein